MGKGSDQMGGQRSVLFEGFRLNEGNSEVKIFEIISPAVWKVGPGSVVFSLLAVIAMLPGFRFFRPAFGFPGSFAPGLCFRDALPY